MQELINKTRGPLQLMLRSKSKVNGFGLTVLPGMGKGKNSRLVNEEEITPQIKMLEKEGYLIIKQINI